MWMLSEAPYPQELGLQILSKSQHTIRSLRFVATRGQTPSKIEVFYATTEMQQNCSSGRHDSVSRYFSASFTSCCDPVKWQPPRSFASGCEQRTMRVDLRRCAFLKLLIYPPNVNPNNNSQVCIQEIELLGAFEPTEAPACGLFASAAADSTQVARLESLSRSAESYDDELHSALLKAGVSLDIVTRVLALPSGDQVQLHGDETAQPAPQLNNRGQSDPSTSLEANRKLPFSQPESHSNVAPVCSLTKEDESIFDSVIRHELLRKAQQDQLVNEIVLQSEHRRHKPQDSSLTGLLCSSSLDSSSLVLGLLLPTISPHDRGNLLEIVMYTFGNFFTECLCCEASDIRVLTISTAERFIGILRTAMGSVVAFEGAVALLRLSLQDTDLRVFQASVRLTHTIFQQDAGFMDDLPDESVVLGLRCVTEALLRNPCCWDVTTTSNWTRAPASQPARSSGVKRRINLDLLKLVRSLISQETMQLSFYRVLLPVNNNSSSNQSPDNHTKSTQGAQESILTGNRLRFIRLLLQRHRAQFLRIPPQVLTSMQIYCEETQDLISASITTSDSSREQIRLAGECLLLLLHSASENQSQEKSKQLASIYAHVNDLESAGSEALYEPAVSQIAFTSEQSRQYQEQTQRYFQARPRPRALYRHTFSEESLQSHSASQVSFQKGNIVFHGHVEQRGPDKISFHERLEQNTKPFVFESPVLVSAPNHEPNPVSEEISTSFAKFRGSVEKRGVASLVHKLAVVAPRISDRTQSPLTQQPVPLKAHAEQFSARGPRTGSSTVKKSGVVPDPTATQVVPTEALPSPADPVTIASSTRRIASAAPASLSRRSAAIDDLKQAPPSQTNTPASSSPPQKTKSGRQHPQTAPAGSQKPRENGDSNPPGCLVQ